MVERPRSRTVTDGPERAPARAMLRAVGFSEEDFGKPQVGVASSWNEVTPCNYHLGKLAALAKEGVRQGDAVPMEFTTIAVSDGIAMGHEGMKASLISRDVIADSVELVMHAERFDGLVGIAGCDKSEPGMLMAMARLNLPSVYLYGGTILAGTYGGRDITIQDVFEAVGAHAKGSIDDAELLGIERAACPTTGSCAGMYTANTMAAAGEALGMSLPGSASPPAVDYRREVFARESGLALTKLLASGLRPRDILTKDAFTNAIAVVMALAGSTNAVLHLLAIAHEAGVELELDDFDRISRVRAAPRRRPPGGEVRDAGSRPRRRCARGDEGAARRRPPRRRRDHGHRQDDRAEPRGARAAGAGRVDRPAVLPADPSRGRNRDPLRLARARGLGDEDRGCGVARVPRARPTVRLRAGGVRRGHQRLDRRGRRHRDPVRGTEGLPGHARDARGHRGRLRGSVWAPRWG